MPRFELSRPRCWQRVVLGGLGLAAVFITGSMLHGSGVATKAQATTAATRPAWSERAVPVLANRKQFTGALSGEMLQKLLAHGDVLFRAKFTTEDGAGRPLATQAIIPTKRRRPAATLFQRLSGGDAASCAACHNDPVVGGAGDFAVNAFVSEGFAQADFDSTDPQFSNERNTNHLFGAGLIELLAREMTAELHAQRASALRKARESGRDVRQALESKGVTFGHITAAADGVVDLDGVEGVDSDLVVRPFSHKGVIVSLRQFTVNALNHHHGMQARERFGARWTGETDFDGDGIADEVDAVDVSALVAWQATLPPPITKRPQDQAWRAAAKIGAQRFDDIGCATCHRPSLPLNSTVFRDPGPRDSAGTLRDGEARQPLSYDLAELPEVKALPRDAKGRVLVPLFGDLKRHTMVDRTVDTFGNELLAQRFVARHDFQTTELWGVAQTAPYGHRGDLTTLDAAIRAHGGDARASRDKFIALGANERSTIIAFLKTLVIRP